MCCLTHVKLKCVPNKWKSLWMYSCLWISIAHYFRACFQYNTFRPTLRFTVWLITCFIIQDRITLTTPTLTILSDDLTNTMPTLVVAESNNFCFNFFHLNTIFPIQKNVERPINSLPTQYPLDIQIINTHNLQQNLCLSIIMYLSLI